MPNTPPAYVNPSFGAYDEPLRNGNRRPRAKQRKARSRGKKIEKCAMEEESVHTRRMVVKMNHP